MALLVPNGGEVIILNYITNKDAPEDLVLRLFTSNTTPAETDTAGTYTEAAWTGYAAVNMVAGDWTVTSGAPSDASAAAESFTSTAAQGPISNYGYYFTRVTTLDLIWAERFTDGPYDISNNGDQINVTPTITLD